MRKIPWIIISILIVVIFLQRECTRVPNCPECPEIDTVYSAQITIHDTFYIPLPSDTVFQDTGSVHYILREVDSNEIVTDYLTKYFYPDTIVNDSNLFVAIFDSVFRNRIIFRHPEIRFTPTIITSTNTVFKNTDPVRKIYTGIGVGRNPEQFGLSASLLYVSKRDNAYSLTYDILNRDIYFSIYWKLKFK